MVSEDLLWAKISSATSEMCGMEIRFRSWKIHCDILEA